MFGGIEPERSVVWHRSVASNAALKGSREVGADAKRGLDMDALGQLYMEGFADLAQHFSVLEACEES